MIDVRQTQNTVYIGRAAEDLALTGVELKVIVPELTPTSLSGTFGAGTTQSNVSLKDLAGGPVTAAPTSANHIIAVWEGESNAPYPPAIKKGEQVEVFQIAGNDRYYWRAKGRDREIRQLDRQRMEVSATTALTSTKDDSNTYFIELNAITNSVTIKTSKANGEPFAYVFRIDTKAGTVLITDDAPGTPNRIFLDSGAGGGQPTIQLNNSKNSSIILLGEDISINAPRDINITAGRQVIQTARVATLNWDIGVVNGTTFGVASSESMVVKSPTFDVIGNSKFTGPMVAYTIRSGAYYTGAIGGSVTMPTTQPQDGTGTPGHNTPDGAPPGVQRHAAAYENLVMMSTSLTDYFNQIQEKIGVPTVGSVLTDQAAASQMVKNAGE